MAVNIFFPCYIKSESLIRDEISLFHEKKISAMVANIYFSVLY